MNYAVNEWKMNDDQNVCWNVFYTDNFFIRIGGLV